MNTSNIPYNFEDYFISQYLLHLDFYTNNIYYEYQHFRLYQMQQFGKYFSTPIYFVHVLYLLIFDWIQSFPGKYLHNLESQISIKIPNPKWMGIT